MEKNKIGIIYEGLYKDGEVWIRNNEASIYFHLADEISFAIIDTGIFEPNWSGQIRFEVIPGEPKLIDGAWIRKFADPIVPFERIK